MRRGGSYLPTTSGLRAWSWHPQLLMLWRPSILRIQKSTRKSARNSKPLNRLWKPPMIEMGQGHAKFENNQTETEMTDLKENEMKTTKTRSFLMALAVLTA